MIDNNIDIPLFLIYFSSYPLIGMSLHSYPKGPGTPPHEYRVLLLLLIVCKIFRTLLTIFSILASFPFEIRSCILIHSLTVHSHSCATYALPTVYTQPQVSPYTQQAADPPAHPEAMVYYLHNKAGIQKIHYSENASGKM